MTHICISKQTIIVSDNGLSANCSQAIIWTNVGILLIRTLGTNFSEIFSEIHKFSFRKIHLKMSSGKWRPSCLSQLYPFLSELMVKLCHGALINFYWHITVWGLWYQKQVSQAWISNSIPQNIIACNYLSMPEIPYMVYTVRCNYLAIPEITASGNTIFIHVVCQVYMPDMTKVWLSGAFMCINIINIIAHNQGMLSI